MKTIKKKKKGFRCAFCGASGKQIELLVLGKEANICDKCVVNAALFCVEKGIDVIGRSIDKLNTTIGKADGPEAE